MIGTDIVTLSLLFKRDSRPDEFMSLSCPARKPLIDVVRPILRRKQSVTRGDHVLVKLDIRGAPGDIDWSSQAIRFVVS